MKKIVYYYLCTFLMLDMLMGFLLLYMGLQESLIINPGQLVRSSLLILLFAILITDATRKLNKKNGIILLTIFYFALYVAVVFIKKAAPGMWADELNTVSKLSFMLLLIYYINKHKAYFLARLDKIMLINFCVLTLNLLMGFFTHLGISTYGHSLDATKGLIYSGNAVSIISLVFLAYYFFKIQTDSKAKYLCFIAVIDIYIVGTKAIFIVPVIFLIYLFTKIKWTPFKVIITASIVTPLLIAGIVLIAPLVSQLFQARYLEMLQKTGFSLGNGQGASGSFGQAVLAYRRIAFAIMQIQHQFQDPVGLIFGYGDSGQVLFWTQKGFAFTFAAMDFLDFLFEYGIVGCLLFYGFIFYPFYLVIKRWEFNALTVSFIFIFLYSFFGGYVIYETTASTMFAFLIALNLPASRAAGSIAQKNYNYRQPVAA